MKTKIVEATQCIEGGFVNHGKFMVGVFDDEYQRRDILDHPLIAPRWGVDGHLLVLDLETGEGTMLRPGGYAKADLDKHRVWVCPLFLPFIEWLYEQDSEVQFDPEKLPDVIELPDAPVVMQGYRRPGPQVNEDEWASVR